MKERLRQFYDRPAGDNPVTVIPPMTAQLHLR